MRRGAAPAFFFSCQESLALSPSGHTGGAMPPLNALTYRGWTIAPRTFQIRGSGQWTLDLVIAYRTKRRAFSGPKTFDTERAAIRGCHAFGRRVIDGQEPYHSVEDLR
jgi:hypothetical protein